jgi:hypothetical protein
VAQAPQLQCGGAWEADGPSDLRIGPSLNLTKHY